MGFQESLTQNALVKGLNAIDVVVWEHPARQQVGEHQEVSDEKHSEQPNKAKGDFTGLALIDGMENGNERWRSLSWAFQASRTGFGKPGFGDHCSMLQVQQLGPPPLLWLLTRKKEYAMNENGNDVFLGEMFWQSNFLSFFKRDTMIELSLCVAGCRPRTNLGKFNRAWWTSNVTAGAMAGAHEIFFGRQLFSWKNQVLNIVAGAGAAECVVWKCALQVAFLNWTCLCGSKLEKGSRLEG